MAVIFIRVGDPGARCHPSVLTRCSGPGGGLSGAEERRSFDLNSTGSMSLISLIDKRGCLWTRTQRRAGQWRNVLGDVSDLPEGTLALTGFDALHAMTQRSTEWRPSSCWDAVAAAWP